MDEKNINVGDIVITSYKSGRYIGEVTDIRPNHYLIKIKSVVKHPMQGDLHNPKQADVIFFHERRALAFGEQTNVLKPAVKHYDGDIPSYEDSLKEALKKDFTALEKDNSEWAKRSFDLLKGLEKEYFKN